MADEPNLTPSPAPAASQTMGNDPATRTTEGTIVDPAKVDPPAIDPAKVDPKAADPKAADPKAPAGPPEKYEFKAPEGRELDAKAIEAATPIFKELGLTNDQAQKLVAFQADRDAATGAAGEKLVTDQRNSWRDEIAKSDLGDGKDNLKPEVRTNIAKAMDSLDPAMKVEFIKSLDLTGAGDNPAIIRAMNAFGKLLSEGSAVRGGGPSTAGQSAPGTAAKPSPAQALFPNLKSSSGP